MGRWFIQGRCPFMASFRYPLTTSPDRPNPSWQVTQRIRRMCRDYNDEQIRLRPGVSSSFWGPGLARRGPMSWFGQTFRALPANLRRAGLFRDRSLFRIRNSFGSLGPGDSCWLIGSNTCLRCRSQLYFSYDPIKGWSLAIQVGPDQTSVWEFHVVAGFFGSSWANLSSSGSTSPKFEKSDGRKMDPFIPSVCHRDAFCWRSLPNDPPNHGPCLAPRSILPSTSGFPRYSEWAPASLLPHAQRVVTSSSRVPLPLTNPSPWLSLEEYSLDHNCPVPGSLRRWCAPTSDFSSAPLYGLPSLSLHNWVSVVTELKRTSFVVKSTSGIEGCMVIISSWGCLVTGNENDRTNNKALNFKLKNTHHIENKFK